MEAPKVFISHATEDKGFIQKIDERLGSYNIRCWVDHKSLLSGKISEKIKKAIEEHSFAIFVLSKNSIISDWVKTEYKLFLQKPLAFELIAILLDLTPEELPDDFSEVKAKDKPFKYYAFSGSQEFEGFNYKCIIEAILEYFSVKDSYFFHDREHIDLALNRDLPTAFEKKLISSLISLEPSHQEYFFDRLDKATWFLWLKREEWFTCNVDSRLTAKKEESSHRRNPSWSLFNYLDLVAQSLTKPEMANQVEGFWDMYREITVELERSIQIIDSWKLERFVKVLSKAPIEIIPNNILSEILKWKINNLLPHETISSLIPSLLEGKVDPERQIAIELLLEEALRVREKVDTIHLGVELFMVGDTLLRDDITHQLSEIASAKFIGFCAQQVVKICLLLRGSGSVLLVSSNEETYEQKLDLRSDNQLRISTFCIKLEAVQKREARFRESYYPEDTRYLLPFHDDDKVLCSEFSGRYQTKASVLQQVIESLKNIPEAGFEVAELNKRVKRAVRYLFSDPFYNGIGENSLRSLKPKWHSKDGAKYISLLFLLKLLKARAKTNPESCRKIIRRFLSSEFPWNTFQRIAIEVINSEWAILKDIIWERLDGDHEDSPFSDYQLKPELGYLIQERIGAFSDDEKKKYWRLIESSNLPLHKSIEWLSPAKDDPILGPHYLRLVNENEGSTNELRPDHTMTWSTPQPPTSKEELYRMSGEELANYLKDFRPEDRFRAPSIDGLSELLRDAVQEKPEWLIPHLPSLLKVYFVYARSITTALANLVNLKEEFSLEDYLPFLLKYISQDQFWENQLKDPDFRETGSFESVMYPILEIGTAINEINDRALLLKWIPGLIPIVSVTFERYQGKEQESIFENPIDQAHNSIQGRMLMAILSLSRKKVDINPSVEEVDSKWDQDLKTLWLQKLAEGDTEAHTLTGRFFGVFYYLDQEWSVKWIEELFESVNKDLWKSFMNGFLSKGIINDQDIYRLMIPHYDSFLEKVIPDPQSSKKQQFHHHFVTHIAQAYLQGWETDDKGRLWARLLRRNDKQEIIWVIFLFNSQQLPSTLGSDDSDCFFQINQRILNFWKHQVNRLGTQPDLTNDDKEVLGTLGLLIERLPNFNEPYLSWCNLSVQHLEPKRYYETDYIKSFLKLKDRVGGGNIREPLAEVLDLFTQTHRPDHPPKMIQELLEFLAESHSPQVKGILKGICNRYAEDGNWAVVEMICGNL